MAKNSIKPIAFLVHYKTTGDAGTGGSGPLQVASALKIFNPNPLIHFPKSSEAKKFSNLSAILISDNSVAQDGLEKELDIINKYCDEQNEKPLKIFLSSRYYQKDPSFDPIKDRGFLVFNQTTDALLIALTVRLYNQTNQLFTREELMSILKVDEGQGLVNLYKRVLETELDRDGYCLGLFSPNEDRIKGMGSNIPLKIILKAISTATDISFDRLKEDFHLEINPKSKAQLA